MSKFSGKMGCPWQHSTRVGVRDRLTHTNTHTRLGISHVCRNPNSRLERIQLWVWLGNLAITKMCCACEPRSVVRDLVQRYSRASCFFLPVQGLCAQTNPVLALPIAQHLTSVRVHSMQANARLVSRKHQTWTDCISSCPRCLGKGGVRGYWRWHCRVSMYLKQHQYFPSFSLLRPLKPKPLMPPSPPSLSRARACALPLTLTLARCTGVP